MIVKLTVRKRLIRFFPVVTKNTGDIQLPGGLKFVELFKSHDKSNITDQAMTIAKNQDCELKQNTTTNCDNRRKSR